MIGGGPAGLAAAHDLRLAGHPVTVYEANERLGGMMVLGIPEYRLSRGVIAREIGAIVELGVEVHTGFRVGHDASLDELLDRHDALFVAVGTGRARDLDLPGHELDGVLRAIEYLLNVNQGFRVDLGERVVVVGGGNVAFDAARTALRAAGAAPGTVPAPSPAAAPTDDDARRAMTTTLDVARAAVRAGVRDVTVIALESPDEIPADPEEIAEAEREGITIVYRRGPHRFVGDDAGDGARDDRRRVGLRRRRSLRADVPAGHRGGPSGRHRDPRRRPGRRPEPARATSTSSRRARAACESTPTRCRRRTRGSGRAATSPRGRAT